MCLQRLVPNPQTVPAIRVIVTQAAVWSRKVNTMWNTQSHLVKHLRATFASPVLNFPPPYPLLLLLYDKRSFGAGGVNKTTDTLQGKKPHCETDNNKSTCLCVCLCAAERQRVTEKGLGWVLLNYFSSLQPDVYYWAITHGLWVNLCITTS